MQPPDLKKTIHALYGLLLLLAPMAFINWPVSGSAHLIATPLLYALLAAGSTAQLLAARRLPLIDRQELPFLLFAGYLLLRQCCLPVVQPGNVALPLLWVLVYYAAKSNVLATGGIPVSRLLLVCTPILILLYGVFAWWHGGGTAALQQFWYTNGSSFAILLAAQVALLWPLRPSACNTGTRKVAAAALAGIAVWLLLLAQGRAALLGLAAAALYVMWPQLMLRFGRRVLLAVVCIVPVLMYLLLQLKPGSSSGRLLVYRVSAQLYQPHWLWGIGSGRFKVDYNTAQAQWFAQHNLNSPAAMLADDTFFAFNDYWQLIIENGLPAMALLLVAAVQIYRYLRAATRTPVQQGATGFLMVVLVAALFSYPLQIPAIWPQVLFCTALLARPAASTSGQWIRPVWLSGLVLTGMALSVWYCFVCWQQLTARQAALLAQTGSSIAAAQLYRRLCSNGFADGDMLYNAARLWYHQGAYAAAGQALAQAGEVYNKHELYLLKASVAAAQQQHTAAKNAFCTAIQMVPCRMRSRVDFFNYCAAQGDTAAALYWGQSVLTMPVKVPSAYTKYMLQQTEERMRALQHKEIPP